jgi:hypothetical protein
MSITVKQLLAFKKTLLQFSKELCEEAQDEYLATMYHEYSEALQEEINKLVVKARIPVKKVSKTTKKQPRKKSETGRSRS